MPWRILAVNVVGGRSRAPAPPTVPPLPPRVPVSNAIGAPATIHKARVEAQKRAAAEARRAAERRREREAAAALLLLRLRPERLRRRSSGRTALRSRPSPRPCRHHLLRAAAEGAADRAARLPTCSTASGPVRAVHRRDPAPPRRRAATAPSRHRAAAARRPLRDRAVGSSFSAEPARGRRAFVVSPDIGAGITA